MKKNLVMASLAGIAVCGLVFGSCNQAPKAEDEQGEKQETVKQGRGLASLEDSISYAYGVGIADNLTQNLESMPADINLNVFMKAFELTMKGETGKLKIKPEEAYQVFQKCIMAIMEQRAQANKKAAAEFMAENGKREGVVTTESGLQYEVLVAGEGAKPTATDRVSVHYHGTLLDGTVFDSSVERGNSVQFGVSQVIPGWTEGLQLMSVGSKYKLYIPSQLAYGDQGAGDVIEPGAMLIFEVELLDIVK